MENFRQKMNGYGAERIPFFFFVDFEQKRPLLYSLKEIPTKIHFSINDLYQHGIKSNTTENRNIHIKADTLSFEKYKQSFEKVQYHLLRGDSYLLNLCHRTRVELSHNLKDIYQSSNAKYKVLVEDKLLCFSPEAFVEIKQGKISSFPMKGTIDASIENAAELLTNDYKESCEHHTIVDLIRNDLSMVAKEVRVQKFKYLDKIVSDQKELLQMSSMISGELEENYLERLGDILCRLLPAGSISGAPKGRTLEIIREAEQEDRGYYTGVFGVFDGKDFESAVAIRFIEKQADTYYYRSGGGITALSDCKKEYQELKDKIYVPVS